MSVPIPPRRLYTNLYAQVVTAIIIGIILGFTYPDLATQMKPLGDGFIKLIRMIIAPVIFCTVVVGIAKMSDMREVGRVGLKTLVYFELVSTLALVIGLMVVNLYQPGAGINADPKTLDSKAVAAYSSGAQQLHGVDFVLNIIPATVIDAFAKGEILQVLLFSVLFGAALSRMGSRCHRVIEFFEQVYGALFGVVGIIMRVAPLGAFGAMAFTIGSYGIGTLLSLAKLMAGVYTTSGLFVFVVLAIIARICGFSLWKFLVYIKEEILLVLGTSSSESALPGMMRKLEQAGCSKSVVGLVVPTGYSFNLDGTSIYLTMATIFLAQAMNVPLGLPQQLGILAVLLLTSKGAAAVTGGGFITLAATLASTGTLPVEGLALLLGVDRFMSECRAITNLIGNGVATMVIARWEGGLDHSAVRKALSGVGPSEVTEVTEVVAASAPDVEERAPFSGNGQVSRVSH